MELDNGGNLKFEYGKPDDLWYKSCHDLILSRFCASDYVTKMISGVKIHQVIKVTNRSLLTRFEKSLFDFVDEFDYLNNK